MARKIQFPGGINLNIVGKEGTMKERSWDVTWQLSTQFISFPFTFTRNKTCSQ